MTSRPRASSIPRTIASSHLFHSKLTRSQPTLLHVNNNNGHLQIPRPLLRRRLGRGPGLGRAHPPLDQPRPADGLRRRAHHRQGALRGVRGAGRHRAAGGAVGPHPQPRHRVGRHGLLRRGQPGLVRDPGRVGHLRLAVHPRRRLRHLGPDHQHRIGGSWGERDGGPSSLEGRRYRNGGSLYRCRQDWIQWHLHSRFVPHFPFWGRVRRRGIKRKYSSISAWVTFNTYFHRYRT
ncbi:hypothetical protein GGR56DRAFT_58516 [Xylariaceae sp. FL0804]|nr:hypothetical protein GGR56DRAFT_58516 [Xylariaceae sp. FL0804]